MTKKILLALLVIIVAMQFYRPEKNISKTVSENDLLKVTNASPEVQQLVKVSCYDCHSNNTEGYKWYAEIAPISWWISAHVNEGKEHLNFSDWGQNKDAQHDAMECAEAIEKGWMPLDSYTWQHPEAVLDANKKKVLVDYFNSLK